MVETLDVVATYVALILSISLAAGAAFRAARDETKKKIENLQISLQEIKGCAQRLEGANIQERLQEVEQRQRVDETSLVRVEERLASVDRSLALLCEQIRQEGRRE